MRISAIWSLFSKKNSDVKIFQNPNFNYLVGFSSENYEITNNYYQLVNNELVEIVKYDIPQQKFSAMLQSDKWSEKL